jgi:hypothetical protein
MSFCNHGHSIMSQLRTFSLRVFFTDIHESVSMQNIHGYLTQVVIFLALLLHCSLSCTYMCLSTSVFAAPVGVCLKEHGDGFLTWDSVSLLGNSFVYFGCLLQVCR